MSALWEAWAESFLASLAARLGGRLSLVRAAGRDPAADFLLELSGRSVWIDAKYKDHLKRLRATAWSGLESVIRESHRAGFH